MSGPSPSTPPLASDDPDTFFDSSDSPKFFSTEDHLGWLVKEVLAAGESAVLFGPPKTLKTSILTDLMISLGSTTQFLKKFEVPQLADGPIPVALFSGESGKSVIRANARAICKARTVTPVELKVRWAFNLPQLSKTEHVEMLAQYIARHNLRAVGFDPLYLSLLAANCQVDPQNIFSIGPLLADITRVCLERGCTPIFCHHSMRRRENPDAEPTVEELFYSGVGQAAQQWMLISRRKPFDAKTGIHKLHFRFGGATGHCGGHDLDIDTGKIDESFQGRKWLVTEPPPPEG